MEQRRVNWPAWLALGISLVALVVAFGSMAMSQRAMWTMWAMPGWSSQQAVPNTPPGWRERGERGQFTPPGWSERGERGQFTPPGWSGRQMPGMAFKGWLSGLIGLVDGLLKLAALALLVWLGIRIFRQRQNPPAASTPPGTPPAPPAPPAPPLTPAGHDPRIE
ncbi:hypothetical protein [Chloroflexus sp.]|uniref:hypothetical protein n=1 Tax=Chloroflexus sp. TaxID=1904827 RepID=UPI00298F0E6B|nr:hypothetical protein [Chloroflexus sp.]MDW8403128.1 hypothetical protein [Chloroflexus sp.]